ncbi:hypothetical protein Tco_1489123, partial [Tanacetum coccineum]
IPQFSGPTDNVADEVVNEEIDDSLERAATTATSLDAKHDRGNINKTQSKATPNKAGSQGTTSGGGPRCQETMGDTIAQTRVLDLETTKTTQANEMASLKKRVKKLERKNKSRTHGLKRMYRVGSLRRVESSEDEGLGEEDASKQGRIVDIDANKYIYLVNVHTDEDMFGVNDLDGDEVIVDNVNVVKTAEETRSVVKEVTAVIKKAKFVSAAEEIVNDAATTVSTASTIPDKGKVKMVEPEKPMKKKELIRLDEEIASKLQAKFDEEAKIEADHELAQRLQAQEQEELSDAENATLFNADEDKDIAELLSLMEVISDEEEVAIDVVSLATKPPTIVD